MHWDWGGTTTRRGCSPEKCIMHNHQMAWCQQFMQLDHWVHGYPVHVVCAWLLAWPTKWVGKWSMGSPLKLRWIKYNPQLSPLPISCLPNLTSFCHSLPMPLVLSKKSWKHAAVTPYLWKPGPKGLLSHSCFLPSFPQVPPYCFHTFTLLSLSWYPKQTHSIHFPYSPFTQVKNKTRQYSIPNLMVVHAIIWLEMRSWIPVDLDTCSNPLLELLLYITSTLPHQTQQQPVRYQNTKKATTLFILQGHRNLESPMVPQQGTAPLILNEPHW